MFACVYSCCGLALYLFCKWCDFTFLDLPDLMLHLENIENPSHSCWFVKFINWSDFFFGNHHQILRRLKKLVFFSEKPLGLSGTIYDSNGFHQTLSFWTKFWIKIRVPAPFFLCKTAFFAIHDCFICSTHLQPKIKNLL